MNYKIININDTGDRSILIIYTGGTFGMVKDAKGALAPFNFGRVVERFPELRHLGIKLTVISFPLPIDSSNIHITDWQDIAYIIEENYAQYDGFIVLHGTDTMAYSASALSYMLHGLNKPVIFTGAQMPIGSVRSDARENLITALEIASSTRDDGSPIICEVCIYFNHLLLRGNRSQKLRSATFAAFESENYPMLAEAGIEIDFNYAVLKPYVKNAKLEVKNTFNPNVSLLKIYPSITEPVVRAILETKSVKGIVLETFGSGNTMKSNWFLQALSRATHNGKIVLNVSQCVGGAVQQGKYETSKKLDEIGVISGGDITTEAAITKLMFLLGTEKDESTIKKLLSISLVGEQDD